MSDTVKPCTKCGVVKPLDDFYRSRKGKFGRMAICKSCRRITEPARMAAYYRANRERRIAAATAYYRANPERKRVTERARYWRKKEEAANVAARNAFAAVVLQAASDSDVRQRVDVPQTLSDALQ